MVADPLRLLEIVMPAVGGAAFIVARKDIERSNANRPAVIRGFGEHIQCKSPSYADDMLVTPIGPASRQAFGMAGLKPADMNMAQVYDCYTHGGQLSFGQAGMAGGASQLVEAVQQIQGRGGQRQVARHDLAYVSGTGGVMSEQTALILEGA
jgi:acetyl-CoA acetyltransferase